MTTEEQDYIETQGLISLERTEKLALLEQFISSQREALIVCGDEGIGKTTLLNSLKKREEAQRAVCVFEETSLLSFGEIKKAITLGIKAQGSIPDTDSLEDMLLFYEEHQQKIVLILDNAGQFPSGFIDKLIYYALKYPALRIIFALTKQELILKSKTDISIDNCYFVEIPALEREGVGVFLKILSLLPERLITEAVINDKLVNKLYQQTKGIPGEIIRKLQKQTNSWFIGQKSLVFTSCLGLGAALIYLYNPILEQNSSKRLITSKIKVIENKVTENKVIESETPLIKETNTVLNSQLNSQEPVVVNPVVKVKEQPVVIKVKEQPVVIKVKEQPVIIKIKEQPVIIKIKEQPVIIKIKEQPVVIKVKKVFTVGDNRQWVFKQASKKYTLQLMLISKKKALLNILKKYKKLQGSLKYIQVTRKNKRGYILLYGSFSTTKAAHKVVKTLPRQFKHAWAKQFKAIQLEIRRSN